MIADEIRRKVESIIGANWDETNAHGTDLRRCLVTPKLVKCDNKLERQSSADPEFRYLWVVVKESAESDFGYAIVCDSAAKNFGLAASDQNGYLFLGWYLDFWAVYKGM